MATEYMRNLMTELENQSAAKAVAPRKPRRIDRRRALLIADGRKALALRRRGLAPPDVLLVIGGSRARLYKAMDAAEQQDKDLLLL
jgi:hypothetical protein